MSEIEVFHDESLTDSSDPPAAVQSTSAPQDNSTEPAAAIRGRRPSRTTAANASKRRSPPSPSPPRQQPPSPASSYTSVFSHAPSAENWTVAGLRQVLISAGVIIPRRSSKADLLALYNSLQSGELQNSSPPLKSATTASKSRKSPYSRPGPILTKYRHGNTRHKKEQARPLPYNIERGGGVGALEASRDLEPGQVASRAVPIPGPMAEPAVRAAMVDLGTRAAMADQATQAAMADQRTPWAMVFRAQAAMAGSPWAMARAALTLVGTRAALTFVGALESWTEPAETKMSWAGPANGVEGPPRTADQDELRAAAALLHLVRSVHLSRSCSGKDAGDER